MDIGKVFGERLLHLREERNETQEQLAKAVGITRQSLSRYETNERTPNIELIYNIAKHYNVSADYLLGLSEVRSAEKNIKISMKTTGFSEDAIISLQVIGKNNPEIITVLNNIVETETKVIKEGLLAKLTRYLTVMPTEGKIFVDSAGTFRTGSINDKRTDTEIEIDMAHYIDKMLLNTVTDCLQKYVGEGFHKSTNYVNN